MKIQTIFLTYGFVIMSLLLSSAALLLAFQANHHAEDAIQLAMQTNQVAQPSRVDIWDTTPIQTVSVNTCFDTQAKLYVVHYQTQNSMVLTNLGGKAIALVGVGFSDGEHEYAVTREADPTTSIGPFGSVEMFPGSSQELAFTATFYSAKDQQYITEEGAQQVVSNLKPTQRAFWQFQFSDGSVYRVAIKSLWFAAGLATSHAGFANCGMLER